VIIKESLLGEGKSNASAVSSMVGASLFLSKMAKLNGAGNYQKW